MEADTQTGIETGNCQAKINFAIKSANGKGYSLYLSETGGNGSYELYDNVNYNSKGAHVRGLTNGKDYYLYIEYDDGSGSISRSETVHFTPPKGGYKVTTKK